MPFFHLALVLILAGEHGVGDDDAFGIIAGDHGRVCCSSHLKQGSLETAQIDNFPTPTEANDAPALDAPCLLQLIDDFGDALEGLWGCSGRLEELAKLGAFLVIVGRVPRDIGRLAIEEIGNEDLVRMVLIRVGEDVGALERLRKEPKDVVYDAVDGFDSVRVASNGL